ncbi:hypothetical protein [Endozoicomonas arenosclerae]|uniref:hypothetical protein n=1 Tax=Endozoicomonas arenosclerae TaxID=1633495 RepID=UPI000780FF2A|nr:hypothetical protein [Endozoicomonas arenosclerae]
MAVSNNQDPQNQSWLGTFSTSASSLGASVWGLFTSSVEPEKQLPLPQRFYDIKPVEFRFVESTGTPKEVYSELKKQTKESLRAVTDAASKSHLDSYTLTAILMTVQQCITDDDFAELTRFTKNFPFLLTHFTPVLGELMDAYQKANPDLPSPWETIDQEDFPGSQVQPDLNIESQGMVELTDAAHRALDGFLKTEDRAQQKSTTKELSAGLALTYLDSGDYAGFIALYEQSAWLQVKLPLNKEHILLRGEELQKLDSVLTSARANMHKSVFDTDCSLKSAALQTAHKGSWDMLFSILNGYGGLELAQKAKATLESDDIDEVSRLVEQHSELKDACSIPLGTLLAKWKTQKDELMFKVLHCRALLSYRAALMSERQENFKEMASATGVWPHQLCNGRFEITEELRGICTNPAKLERTDKLIRRLIQNPEWNGRD